MSNLTDQAAVKQQLLGEATPSKQEAVAAITQNKTGEPALNPLLAREAEKVAIRQSILNSRNAQTEERREREKNSWVSDSELNTFWGGAANAGTKALGTANRIVGNIAAAPSTALADNALSAIPDDARKLLSMDPATLTAGQNAYLDKSRTFYPNGGPRGGAALTGSYRGFVEQYRNSANTSAEIQDTFDNNWLANKANPKEQ